MSSTILEKAYDNCICLKRVRCDCHLEPEQSRCPCVYCCESMTIWAEDNRLQEKRNEKNE